MNNLEKSEKMRHMNFKDKVTLITGASKGIGRTTANKLAQLGAKIVLTGRDEKALYEVQKNIKDQGGNAVFYAGDICDEGSCRDAVEFTLNTYKDLDILINNAGVSMRGGFSDMNFEVIDRVYRTNLVGATYISAISLPFIRKAKGSMVFVSSIAGIRGLPYNSVYCASKMALRGIAESIRIEEYGNDVHVGLIYVGITEIDKGKQTLATNGKFITLKDRKDRKIMTQDEVARAIIENIMNRKFISTLSGLGKLNSFVQKLSPRLAEYILSKSVDRVIQDGQ